MNKKIASTEIIDFKQPLNIPIGVRLYRLEETYVIKYKKGGGLKRLVIPKGFVYDGNSNLRFLWSVTGITPDGLHRAASLVHDYMHRHGGYLPVGSLQVWHNGEWMNWDKEFGRDEADLIFYYLMIVAGVNNVKATTAYLGVRGFGWISWREK